MGEGGELINERMLGQLSMRACKSVSILKSGEIYRSATNPT